MSGKEADWHGALLNFRQRKDDYFRTGQGPLKGTDLDGFAGLAYFPPAPEWAFALPLQPAAGSAEFMLHTNTGEQRFMALIGTVHLPLPDGTEQELQVFGVLGDEERHSGFLPFRDQTSGTETYGAGRYVDAPLQGGVLRVDFNRAYHPYCAYDDGWTCPLPPSQNQVRVAVRAGEKLPASAGNDGVPETFGRNS